VHDVAAFILREYGVMTTYKLQKLVYYAQGWTLGLTGEALFPEPLQAWRQGPASRALFATHATRRNVSSIQGGNPDALTPAQTSLLRRELARHAAKSVDDLVDDTHSESPWLEARVGLPPHASGTREITPDALREFFGNPVIQGILRTDGADGAAVEELADMDRAGP
jgi:uncharacterized phage-associated protein